MRHKRIDAANANASGITINPNHVSDLWIVDSGTLQVYQYLAAADRTSGSQDADAAFALAPGDTAPQGIADPPPNLRPTPSRAPAARTRSGRGSSSFPCQSQRDLHLAGAGVGATTRRLLRGPDSGRGASTGVGPHLAPVADGALPAAGLAISTALAGGPSHALRSHGKAVGLLPSALVDEQNPASAAATDLLFAGLVADL